MAYSACLSEIEASCCEAVRQLEYFRTGPLPGEFARNIFSFCIVSRIGRERYAQAVATSVLCGLNLPRVVLANLIGQLGDPHYLRKANVLYYEFEEVGMNKQLGYSSPADLTDLYPKFYWSSVSTHIESAIRYLNVTSSGRQWIANLHSNIFRAERELSLSGPQR